MLFVVAVAARKEKRIIFAAQNTKIRVGFRAPGWLFESGTPPPELLAGFCDFDHLEHGPRSPAGANACTVLSAPAPFGSLQQEARKKNRGQTRKVNYSGKNGPLVQSNVDWAHDGSRRYMLGYACTQIDGLQHLCIGHHGASATTEREGISTLAPTVSLAIVQLTAAALSKTNLETKRTRLQQQYQNNLTFFF